MKKFVFGIVSALMVMSSSSVALEASKSEISCRTRNHCITREDIQIVAMNELVADSLAKLDVSKRYECVIKSTMTDLPMGETLLNVYSIKSCTVVDI